MPEGPAAQHPYGVLVDAFQQPDREALFRVVLQRQLVLVYPSGRLLDPVVVHGPPHC